MGDRVLLRSRSWRWLSVRILGLLGAQTRLRARLIPDKKPPTPTHPRRR